MIKIRRLCLFLFVFLLLFTACQKELPIEERYETIKLTDYVDQSPTSGGTVLIPLSVIDTLNPLLTKNESYFYFSKLIFESLFAYNENGELEPLLAEHYLLSNDGKRINITLRSDVYWHDGAELRAEDVAMSLEAIKGLEEDSPYRQSLDSLVGAGYAYDIHSLFKVEVYDSKNLDIIFDRSYVNAIDILTFPILPSHLLSEGKIFQQDNFTPIGTGPYQLYQYKSGRELILKSNDRYADNPPMIKMVRGKIFNDKSRSLTAFETGQIDMSIAHGSDWEKYKDNQRIKTYPFPAHELEMLAMNINSSKFQGEPGKAIRQAISYGINRQVIIDRVYLGNAEEPSWLLDPHSREAKLLKTIPLYDVDRAKSILEDAGLKDSDNDGIREWLDGNPIRITILSNLTNRDRNLITRYIAEDLRILGLDPIIIGGDRNTVTANEDLKRSDFLQTQGAISRGDFDIAIYGIQLTPITDLSMWLSSASINGKDNVANYHNDRVDELVRKTKYTVVEDFVVPEEEQEESQTSSETLSTDQSIYGQQGETPTVTTDPETTINQTQDITALVNELMDICTDDPAYVALAYKQRALLMDTRVMGEPKPTVDNIYKNLHNLYIPIGLQ